MCYITLRGLVYFGASIHVYHGVQMFVNMYYDLFATSATKDSAATVSQVDIIFNCCFLTLGILVFRGVELNSKTCIKFPTIAFTLLLAMRFIVEIVKQVEREREGGVRLFKHTSPTTISPFSYSSMSIDVDPLISAAVGIYIFILFVYNHSLEYDHQQQQQQQGEANIIPPRHSSDPSDCGAMSDASSDTVLLLNTPHARNNNTGDTNNNSSSRLLNQINTRANPLFEMTLDPRPIQLNIPPPPLIPSTQQQQYQLGESGRLTPPTPPEYKVDAV